MGKIIEKYSIPALRISIGFCFVFFGLLKFFPGGSPAYELASTTVGRLTFGTMTGDHAMLFLAILESVIGWLLIFKLFIKVSLSVMIVHLLFTFSTFIVSPELVIGDQAFSLSIEGQYVIKNLIIICAAFVVMRHYLKEEKETKEASQSGPE